jgi:asparagine synthase (glutamine-hydrolysing)
MSALAGRIDCHRRTASAGDRALVARMLDRQRHRCPDGTQIDPIDGGCLGVGWLHATEPPPSELINPVEGITVVADARIDNRDEVLDACAVPPELRAKASDADIIRLSYLRWRERCAERLQGDFAFVLWDARRRELHGARDRLGLRMLYYAWDGRLLSLATEPSALFVDPTLSREPNDFAIALHIANRYSENGETLYRNVRSLESAHRLQLDRSGIRIVRYWRLDRVQPLPRMGDEGYADMLRAALATAVRQRTRGRRRMGVLVSGGMDSSAVACELERQRRQGCGPAEPPTVLRLSFPGMACDETPFGRAVAAHLGLPLVEIDALSRPDLTAPSRVGPPTDLVYLPQSAVAEALLQTASSMGLRSVASGEGGDFCMSGTGHEVADAFNTGRARDALRLAFAGRPLSARSCGRALALALGARVPARWTDAIRRSRAGGDSVLLAPRWIEAVRQHRLAEESELERRRFENRSTAVLAHRLETMTLNSGLVRQDRKAGAYGVEMVSPFFDVPLAELLLAMPNEQRHVVGQTKPKPVLRRAMRSWLPPRVYRRTDAAVYSCFLYSMAFERHGRELRAMFDDSLLLARGLTTRAAIVEAAEVCTSYHPAAFQSVRFRNTLNLAAMEIWLRRLCS